MSIPRFSSDRTVVNLSNSILKHYGISGPHHDYFKDVDDILSIDANRGKKLVLIVVGGLGSNTLKKFKGRANFLYSSKISDIDSVYPTCSEASWTSICFYKYPMETGWLGQFQYFDKIPQYLEMNSGVVHGTNIYSSSVSTGMLAMDKSLTELIQRKYSEGTATKIMGSDCLNSKNELSSGLFFTQIDKALQNEKNNFTLAYWPKLRDEICKEGLGSPSAKKSIEAFSRSMEVLVNKYPNIIFMVVGDHGEEKVQWIDIRKYKDFTATLEDVEFSIEPRFASFRVKEECTHEFETLFLKYFSKDFELYTKEQAIRESIFGYGSQHKLFDAFLGKYILVSKGKKAFNDGYFNTKLKAYYGGTTKAERIVPLCMFNIQRKK